MSESKRTRPQDGIIQTLSELLLAFNRFQLFFQTIWASKDIIITIIHTPSLTQVQRSHAEHESNFNLPKVRREFDALFWGMKPPY